MKKILLLFAGVVCPFLLANAQHQKIHPLHVGDTVPDLVFRDIRNYSQPDFSLRHFKGQLLILDFWAIGCTSCVHLMPVLDSLRHVYGDRLTIVSVTGNQEEPANRFIARFLRAKNPQLPSLFGDTLLSKMFPHVSVPHEVWIDSRGVVRAITDSRYVRAKYIDRILADENATLPLKKDFLGYNSDKPLLVGGNGGQGDQFSYRSMITPFLEGVNGASSIHKGDRSVTVTGINLPVIYLYQLVFAWKIITDPKRVRLELRDSSKYFQPHADPETVDAWRRTHTYCYQLTLPASRADQLQEFGLQDMNRYFNLNGRMEVVPLHCLLIVRSHKNEKLHFPSVTAPVAGATTAVSREVQMIEKPMSRLYYYLNAIPSLPRVVDETGYRGKINIRLSGDTSLTGLQRELAPYRLKLVPAVRPTKIFILTEK